MNMYQFLKTLNPADAVLAIDGQYHEIDTAEAFLESAEADPAYQQVLESKEVKEVTRRRENVYIILVG